MNILLHQKKLLVHGNKVVLGIKATPITATYVVTKTTLDERTKKNCPDM